MPSNAIENIAGMTFGSTSRTHDAEVLAPWARAAITNSRCDHCSVFARVIRPRIGIDDDAERDDEHDEARANETGMSASELVASGCSRAP